LREKLGLPALPSPNIEKAPLADEKKSAKGKSE